MRRPKLPSPSELEDRCRAFNAAHPIGTFVKFHPVIGTPNGRYTKTESGAYVLAGHTAVIFLEGISGCVSLDAVEVVPRAAAPFESSYRKESGQ